MMVISFESITKQQLETILFVLLGISKAIILYEIDPISYNTPFKL